MLWKTSCLVSAPKRSTPSDPGDLRPVCLFDGLMWRVLLSTSLTLTWRVVVAELVARISLHVFFLAFSKPSNQLLPGVAASACAVPLVLWLSVERATVCPSDVVVRNQPVTRYTLDFQSGSYVMPSAEVLRRVCGWGVY